MPSVPSPVAGELDIEGTDQLLTTTRSVRRRLEVTRPVPQQVVMECLEIAMQAPASGAGRDLRWVVVTEASTRSALGDLYRQACQAVTSQGTATGGSGQLTIQQQSEDALAQHLGEVPVLIAPCFRRRGWHESSPHRDLVHATVHGSVFPAVWSFQLAARARGLGTCFVAAHLRYADRAAQILCLPEEIGQAGLIAVAATSGKFRRARRPNLADVARFDRWKGGTPVG
jgi:nitroreductase